jgi:hypothetical protein
VVLLVPLLVLLVLLRVLPLLLLVPVQLPAGAAAAPTPPHWAPPRPQPPLNRAPVRL